jgi:hypothetical protein
VSEGALPPWVMTGAPLVLFVFGLGFLAANVKLIVELVQFQTRKRTALLVWEAPKPRFYAFNLALGVACGVLLSVELFVLDRPIRHLFGEAMMFVYYGYAFPLSTRISRGFYRDGVWSDSGFMRWARIAAVSWKDGQAARAPDAAPELKQPTGTVTLVLISSVRNLARRLTVPGPVYGQARRVLLDRIKAHDIHIGGTGLDLGSRGETDGI